MTTTRTTKRGRGRPRSARTVSVFVRLTPAEKALVTAAAARDHRTAADWARVRLLGAASSPRRAEGGA